MALPEFLQAQLGRSKLSCMIANLTDGDTGEQIQLSRRDKALPRSSLTAVGAWRAAGVDLMSCPGLGTGPQLNFTQCYMEISQLLASSFQPFPLL